jgi:alkane 1-monooxygenase
MTLLNSMIKYIKYTNPLMVYALAFLSFTSTGLWCWMTLIFTWVAVPLVELLIKPDSTNMSKAEAEVAKNDGAYDLLLYLIVVLQIPMLIFFLFAMQNDGLSTPTIFARIFTMGLLCGTFGINVGHELGHRNTKFEQNLAKLSLLSSLYMHFFVEHNKGHHKNVATYNDPSSARLNEPVYSFYFRTIINSYRSAWHIANQEVLKKGKSKLSLSNEMVQMHLIQLFFVALIYLIFGGLITLYFLAAAFIGILLLETVNYIEHYGLQRKQLASGGFERTLPQHSWNSNHVLGRMLLFELSRHSDHHYLASKKYQVLSHYEQSPQLPTGYPGSMVLALMPPLWFSVMNKKIVELREG